MPNGIWDSGIRNQGATFTRTFNSAGTFPYYCTPHGGCCNMVGTVTVVSETPTPQPTATATATPRPTATATPRHGYCTPSHGYGHAQANGYTNTVGYATQHQHS